MWLSGVFAATLAYQKQQDFHRHHTFWPMSIIRSAILMTCQVVLNNKKVLPHQQDAQNNNKLSDILKMKASWLVQNLKGFASPLTVSSFTQQHAAPRHQSVIRLAKVNVAKTNIVESLQLVRNARNILKNANCLMNSHIKHVETDLPW